jgi:2-polyprenyl-3-methyl-5-hydroxy-6-metoxy-1,4-benzoquinol methylase
MKKNLYTHNINQIEYFEKNIKKTMLPTYSHYVNRQIDKMIKVGRLEQKEEILEMGCGMGRYTLPLLERHFNLSGLDISRGLLEKLKKFNSREHPLSLYCVDIIDGSEKIEKRFDSVIGFFTLHHVDNLKSVFRGIYNLLKPEGRIAFLEPNPCNPLYYIQIFLTPGMNWSMEKGMLNLRKDNVFNILKETGFVKPSVYRFGFFPPFIVNTKIGLHLEKHGEELTFLYPFLPFQIFTAEKNEF